MNEKTDVENESKTVETTPFRTKDLNQAAFMWCQDRAELLELDATQERGRSLYFHFQLEMSHENMRSLIFDYMNGKTIVEPHMFVDRQNRLRDMLHANLARKRSKNDNPDTIKVKVTGTIK